MKKSICFLFIFMMLFSAASCKSNKKPASSGKSSSVSSKSSAEVSSENEEYSEAVSSEAGDASTVIKTSSTKSSSKAGSVSSKQPSSSSTSSFVTNYKPKIKTLTVATSGRTVSASNTIGKYLKEKLGCAIELVYISDGELRNKLGMMASADNLPDIFSIPSGQDIYKILRDSGMLADLEPLLNTYAPNILSNRTWDQLNYARDNDGKLRSINANIDYNHWTLIIRQDWLDKLNLKVPKTTADFKAVMKAFVENDPDGNGKKDTVGFLTAQGPYGLGPFYGAFDALPGIWRTGSDGKVVFGSAQQQIKDALKYMRNLREEGIFPSNWRATRDDFNKAVSDGKVGLIYESLWWMGGDILSHDSSAKWVYIDPPAGPGGKSGYINWWDPQMSKRTCISAKSKDAAAAMCYLNLLADYEVASTVRNGIEGLHYKQSATAAAGYEPLEPFKSDTTLAIADGVTSTYALPFLLEDPIRAFCLKTQVTALTNRKKKEINGVLYDTPDNVLSRTDLDISYDTYAQTIQLKLINEGGNIDSEYQNCITALNNNYKLGELTKLYQQTYDAMKKAGVIK